MNEPVIDQSEFDALGEFPALRQSKHSGASECLCGYCPFGAVKPRLVNAEKSESSQTAAPPAQDPLKRAAVEFIERKASANPRAQFNALFK